MMFRDPIVYGLAVGIVILVGMLTLILLAVISKQEVP